MKTIINLKALLIFLSLVVLLMGSCKAGDKLGSVNQDSQISGGSVSNSLNTSLPIWNVKHYTIPEEYWGKYQYLDEDGNLGIATVTSKDITFYNEDDSSFRVWAYFHVFDKNARHWGDDNWSCWSWPPLYSGDNYINKYKNDFRLSILPENIITFNRNEKEQRVLFFNRGFDYVHEDDINK